ncbi:sugar transporter, partial [Thioclava sp. BHET1]
GYTVQDDGAIAIPNVGRVQVAGKTVQDAEAAVFQALVSHNIDPSFSLEISQFHSQRVSIGGAVGGATVVPITLQPLQLDEALAAAGGMKAPDRKSASIRIYRKGKIYQIPLDTYYSDPGLQNLPLENGDSVFVDTQYDLATAQAYFQQQIALSQFKQQARISALSQLSSEVALRRAELEEQRQNFQAKLQMDAVERDYVYITGEFDTQTRYALPFGHSASLADAIYGAGKGIPTRTGDVAQIYVLRGSSDPREFGAVTAWHLNAKNAANLVLAAHFKLHPDDIIFVAEQPITKWNRVLQQFIPSFITTTTTAATRN